MAFSTAFFHFPRSWTQAIQFLTFIWQMSCLTLSSHLYLGLPCDLLVTGFHLNIFLGVLVSGILCTWPNQLSLWALIWLTIFLCFISLSNSSLVLNFRMTIIIQNDFQGNLKRKYISGKWILKASALKACNGLNWHRIGPIAGSCEHGWELPDVVRAWNLYTDHPPASTWSHGPLAT